jgi:N-formylglutamate amidohydrolase
MLNTILNVDGDEGQSIPLIIDSPHSGQVYPSDFNHQADFSMLRQAEDTYVDELYKHISSIGGIILDAKFPRSYIDLNRSETDFSSIDILDANNSFNEIKFKPSVKSELGIGLIWLRIPPNGEPMYANKITLKELMKRVQNYYRPYHKTLKSIMDKTYRQFGKFYHINAHSMQDKASTMSTQAQGTKRPDFVIGDRDGTSCERAFRNVIIEYLRDSKYNVAVNDPYKGFELVSAYSSPLMEKHSIQIEVNRRLYMNEETRIKNAGFNELKYNLEGLLEALKAWIKY